LQTSLVRLFVAVTLPAPITELLATLPRPGAGHLRWTTPAQWHITLRFLGQVDRPSEVIDAVGGGTLGTGDHEAVLGPATEWFPGRRVLHVPVAGLDDVAANVRALTARWGPDTEAPYLGHVTLARVRGRGRGPIGLAGTRVAGHFAVHRIAVVASSLGAGAAAYQVLATVPLDRHQG
jgi:2'-5' RNA ligase